jgi:hypothetical protein
MERLGWRGTGGRGLARSGQARQCRQGWARAGVVRQGTAGKAGAGLAGAGLVRHGRHGLDRRDKAGRIADGLGMAAQARRDVYWVATGWHGEAPQARSGVGLARRGRGWSGQAPQARSGEARRA